MRWLWLLVLLTGCTRFGPVYPSRPPTHPSPLVADPPPSRVTTHVSLSGAALRDQLEAVVPKVGDGTLAILASERPYRWTRGPLDVSFANGRVVVKTSVASNVDLPISSLDLPFEIQISAEPVINTGYQLKLQSTNVEVRSDDRRLKVVDQVAGVFDRVGKEIDQKLRGFAYELRPLLEETYRRVQKPLPLPMGEATGCAQLRVLGVEAAPLILADGVEKDFALVVAPSITIPCTPQGEAEPLPPLANVAMVPTGPFTVTVPIVASYAELTRGLSAAFTDGKLFFSKEHPKLYLEHPELYESEGSLVLRLHIKGPVHELGIDADLDGDLFLVGKPLLVDNEIALPDLEPTIETRSFLLSLKAMKDSDVIRAEARKALRLDLTERLREVREKLSSELTFGTAKECFVGRVNKLDLQDLHAHQQYMRVNIVVTAQASASLPCSSSLPAPPPAAAP
jgi:hypothetical protein